MKIVDKILGYGVLCWMCRRPLFVKPPELSEILKMTWRGDDSLERYLKSLGFEFVADDVSSHASRPVRFSELKPFVDSNSKSSPPLKIRKIKRQVK